MASFTERYHELTKYHPYSVDRPVPLKWESRVPSFRAVENLPQIALPLWNDAEPVMPKAEEFGTLPFLSYLLQMTSGITGELSSENGPVHYRAYCSGGNLYPIEVFVMVRDSEIPAGLYYYDPEKGRLCRMLEKEVWNRFPGMVNAAADTARLVFLYTGVLERSVWRYKENAYRRILLDAGSSLGNTMIQASAIGVGAVPLSGFVDSSLERLLELRPGEVPLAVLAVDPAFAGVTSREAVPGLEPCVASEILSFENAEMPLQAQLLCQNQAERIPDGHFRAAVPFWEDSIPGERIPLFPSSLTPDDIRCSLPVYAWHRRVCRSFSPETLPFGSLSVTLQLAYGSGLGHTFSAGFLKHWLLVFSVDMLEAGLYRYLPREHALVRVNAGISRSVFDSVHVSPVPLHGCSAVLLHTADLDQVTSALGDRGYRYLHLDAGILCEALNVWGAFVQGSSSSDSFYFEDEYKKALGLPRRESLITESALGMRNA